MCACDKKIIKAGNKSLKYPTTQEVSGWYSSIMVKIRLRKRLKYFLKTNNLIPEELIMRTKPDESS